MGTGGQETRCPLQARLQVDLSLRFRASSERRGLLADPAHGQCGVVLDGTQRVRQRGGSRRAQVRPFGGGSGRLWHTGKEVEIPEGIHLEFLPSGSPELMPAERLWPLTNEALANELFEEIEEVEEALVERCLELLDQPEAIRELTNKPFENSPTTTGGPRRHDVPSTFQPDLVSLILKTGRCLPYRRC